MPFPENSDITVTIDSVDVTDNIEPESFNIKSAMTSKVDTFKCTLRNAGSIGAEAWKEIIATDGADKIFGGYVQTPSEFEGLDAELEKPISAADYACYFDHVTVTEEYEDESDKDMLILLFAEYLAGLGFNASTYVTEVLEHPLMRFNKITLRQCIDFLADLAGAEWYVDADKNLHFFVVEEFSAPFSISDTPDLVDSFPCSDLVVMRDGAGVANRVDVFGGFYLGVEKNYYIAGTNQSNVVNIPLKLHAPTGESSIQVWRNDGTEGTPVWTPMTVKTAYIDTLAGTDEVLYYFEEKSIEQQNSFPDLPNALRVYGRPEIPLHVRATSQASKDFYGLWLDYKIVNKGQLSQEIAKSRATTKLAESSFASEGVTFDVEMPGLLAGQKISITNELHGFDDLQLLIYSVIIKVGVGGETVSSVSAGIYDPDLVDLIRELFLNSQEEIEWKDDEVLLLIFQQNEAVTLSETVDTSPTQRQAPYYYTPNDTDPNAGFYPNFAYTPTE